MCGWHRTHAFAQHNTTCQDLTHTHTHVHTRVAISHTRHLHIPAPLISRTNHAFAQHNTTRQDGGMAAVSSAMSHTMGWLRLVGSLKLKVSFVEFSLFYRALLQKRPRIWMTLDAHDNYTYQSISSLATHINLSHHDHYTYQSISSLL